MTITIPPDLEEFIEQQVKAGHHPDPAHVVSRALSAWRDAVLLDAADHEELKAAIQEGINDLRNGRSAPWNFDDIKAEGMRLQAQSHRKAK